MCSSHRWKIVKCQFGITSMNRPSRNNSGCTSGGGSPMPVPASSAIARPVLVHREMRVEGQGLLLYSVLWDVRVGRLECADQRNKQGVGYAGWRGKPQFP